MATTVITLTHDQSTADMTAKLDDGDKYNRARKLSTYFEALAGGVMSGTVDLQVGEGDAVAASGTITFSDTGAADDTVLVNGVTFTAVAAGATGNQWNVGADAAESAENLAAAINASATALVSEHVTAADDGAGVVTVTAVKKGASGNAITIAEGVDAGADMAVSGARLTGGTNATADSQSYGR